MEKAENASTSIAQYPLAKLPDNPYLCAPARVAGLAAQRQGVQEEPRIGPGTGLLVYLRGAQQLFMADLIDDFDWDNVGATGFGGNYSADQRAEMEKMYGDTLTTVQEEEVVTGTVVGITDRDVILNIGFKSDGLVSITEFRDQRRSKAPAGTAPLNKRVGPGS